MTLVFTIVRILVILMIVRLVLRFVAGLRSVQTRAPRQAARVPERAGGTLVRDPHCGTYVAESRAVPLGTGANAVHFCSTACRDAWREAHGPELKAQQGRAS